uniref:CHHC U11-48K-type domain-containing protein n=1 Tax=Anopheles maculatus TaxID=74869 RepID=A0A182SFC5_9DIPT
MSNLRECPYDPLHQISAKTFALHLVKCKRQHPDVKLATCYFDSSHLVKEEELKQHMKTCSGRKQLLEYKTTIDKTASSRACKQEDPAENLIYNTTGPSKQKNDTGGQSLQDDTDCWDDFAYKAYDPLANCKSKLQSSKTFILPNPNKFAGQMQAAAAVLVETQNKDVQDGSQSQQKEANESEGEGGSLTKNATSTGHEASSSWHCEVKENPSDCDEAASSSSSRRQRKERHFEEPSSSRRYEAKSATSYRFKSDKSSHRSRSRSDSTSNSDRKSQLYDGYYDGYAYRGSYDASRGHRDDQRDRYVADTDRGRYDRHAEYHRTSSRSYDSSKHKYEPYQRSQQSYNNWSRHARDYE